MATIHRRNQSIGFDALSEVERLAKILESGEETLESRISRKKNQIKLLQHKIRDAGRELKDYLDRHGETLDLPFFADHPNDSVVPDTVPKDASDYINHASARTKSFPDPTYQTYSQSVLEMMGEYHRKKLEIHDRLILYINQKSKAEEDLQRLQNLLKYPIKWKEENQEAYKTRRDMLYEIMHLMEQTSDIRDLYEDYPDGYTVEEAILSFDVNMDKYCIQYRVRRNKLIRDIKDFKEDFAEQPAKFTEAMDGILLILEDEGSFPKQFTEAVKRKSYAIKDLNNVLILLRALRASALAYIKELSGMEGIPNAEVARLEARVKRILTSEVKKNNADTITKEQEDGLNNENLNKSVEAVNKVKKALEKAGDDVDELISKYPRRLLGRIANVFGFGKRNKKPPDQSLEDYWRARVRKKYGGNVPFCDEVQITEDGEQFYVKKSEAKQVNGVWVRREKAKASEYNEKAGAVEEDIYG